MSFDIAKLEDHIERLRVGDTLTENEVKALCEKVRLTILMLVFKYRSIAAVLRTVRWQPILHVISIHDDR
jgi:hypothetical protein